jgi:hypothetical protein
MSDLVLASERMLTPTVAVICVVWVVALAAWGHIRLKIMPAAPRAATARTLINALRTVRPPPRDGFFHISHTDHKLCKFNFATFVTARVPVESRCFGNPMRSARFGSARVDNGLHTVHVGRCGRIER